VSIQCYTLSASVVAIYVKLQQSIGFSAIDFVSSFILQSLHAICVCVS